MTVKRIYLSDDNKIFYDYKDGSITLPDGTVHNKVTGHPEMFGDIQCADVFDDSSYILVDTRFDRLLIASKKNVIPFGPVVESPYIVLYAEQLIFVAIHPYGIEPALIEIIDRFGELCGRIIRKNTVTDIKSTMMNLSRDIKSLTLKDENIEIAFSDTSSTLFNLSKPETFEHKYFAYQPVIKKEAVSDLSTGTTCYSIYNESTVDYAATSVFSSYGEGFQNNIGYSIENIDNHSISIHGMYTGDNNYSTLSDLVGRLTDDCKNETEKLYSLWKFTTGYMTFGVTWPKQSFKSDQAFSLVRFLHGMGSGVCGSFNGVLAILCKAAGIPVKTGSLANGSHAALRVLIDGKDIYIDALYGGTPPFHGSVLHDEWGNIRTYEQLCNDTYLIKKASGESAYDLASMIGYNDRWIKDRETGYQDPHTMSYTLKPFEKMEFSYRFNGMHIGTIQPESNIVSGKKIFKASNNPYAMDNMKFIGEISKKEEMYICTGQTSIEYFADCPYPITGMQVSGRIKSGALTVKTDFSKKIRSYDECGDFHAFFNHKRSKALHGACYEVTMDISCMDTVFEIYEITIYFQANKLFLCSLNKGLNDISIVSDGGKVKLSHQYIQSIVKPPVIPIDVKKQGKRFILNSNEYIHCEFILSKDKDCDIPYAPIFHTVTNEKQIEFDLNSILSSNNKYYYKARCQSKDGIWSEWSKIHSFMHKAPKKPEGIKLSIEGGDLILSWDKADDTRSYKIYASNEAAFTPSDKSYLVKIKRNDTVATHILNPGNHILTVSDNRVNLSKALEYDDLKYHYRIVAIDESKNASIASDYVSLDNPYILQQSICKNAYAGCEYFSFVKCIYSIGRMCFNRTPEHVMYTDYSQAHILKYTLHGPSWLNVREYDGYLYGVPDAQNTGVNSFVLTAKNQFGQAGRLAFEIFVEPGHE